MLDYLPSRCEEFEWWELWGDDEEGDWEDWEDGDEFEFDDSELWNVSNI